MSDSIWHLLGTVGEHLEEQNWFPGQKRRIPRVVGDASGSTEVTETGPT